MKIKILEKLKKINFSKKSKIIFIVFIVLGLFIASPASAGFKDWVIEIVSQILGLFVSMLAWILLIIVNALISVASWDLFIKAHAVGFGWTVVRDLCNMFFIVLMLVMAFGTILNSEKFNYKKVLPKLILMAILINFSKTICGLLIDMTQIIMMTFVASFSTFGAGAMVDNLGLTDIVQLSKASKEKALWPVIAAYLLGAIYVIIAIIVCVAMLAMLAIRIVMIWIYVVLSPLAYLLGAFPPGQKYASQWWSEFTKNLIVGPVLAFFLWLSIVSLQADKMVYNESTDKFEGGSSYSIDGQDALLAGEEGLGVTKATSPEALIKFVIAIGMLVGGLQISSQIGGAAGSMAGKGMANVNKLVQSGARGAAAVTGARYASGVYKSYKGSKEADRGKRWKDHADIASGAIGKTKRGLNPAYHIAKSIGTDKKAKKVGELMQRNKDQIETSEQNFSEKTGTVNLSRDATRDYKYNKLTKKWTDDEGNKLSASEMEERREEVRRENEQSNIYERTADDTWVNKRGDTLEDEEMARRVEERRLSYETDNEGDKERLSKVTGGPAVLFKKMFKSTFSNTDIERSSNRRVRNVQEKQKEYEKLSDVDLENARNDKTLSATDRAASSLVALNRGHLSSEKAVSIKEELMKGEGLGGSSKDGTLNDKELGKYISSFVQDSAAASTTELYNKAGSADLVVSEKAKADIRTAFQSGKISLGSLNSSAMERFIPELTTALSPKQISSSILEIKNKSQQSHVIDTLQERVKENNNFLGSGEGSVVENSNRKAESSKVMHSLAYATDVVTATKNADPQTQREVKNEFINKIDYSSIVKMYNESSGKQKDALIQAVRDTGAKVDDFKAASGSMKSNSPMAKAMMKDFGFDTDRGGIPGDDQGQWYG